MVLAKHTAHFSSVEKTIVMMGTGSIVFSALALFEHAKNDTVIAWLTLPFKNRNFLISLIYLAVITSALAFALQNFAISRIGATRSASFAPLTTLISIAAGELFMDEPLSLSMLIGAIMILAGVIGANRQPVTSTIRNKRAT